MRMGKGVRTGLGHGGITCVLQTQFSSLTCHKVPFHMTQILCFTVMVYEDENYYRQSLKQLYKVH